MPTYSHNLSTRRSQNRKSRRIGASNPSKGKPIEGEKSAACKARLARRDQARARRIAGRKADAERRATAAKNLDQERADLSRKRQANAGIPVKKQAKR